MKDFSFLAGLVFGTTFSIACFLYGTNRIFPRVAVEQMPISQQHTHYATGEFTRP